MLLAMRITALLFALILAHSGPATAQNRELSDTGALLDRIVAVVNDGVVLQSELDTQTYMIAQRLNEAGQQLPSQQRLREQVLERLILVRIQLQRAERLGIQVSDDMLNAALARVAEANKIPFGRLPEALQSQGIEYAQYREEMRREMTLENLKQRDVVRRINVTPREIEKFLEEQADAVMSSREYRISHILVALPAAATAQQHNEVEQKVEGIYQRLQDGEDFGQIAVAFSDSQTALEGGDLGWRKGEQIPSLFAKTVMQMSAGTISEPIRGTSGFHIVRLEDVRGENQEVMVKQFNARHILVVPNEILDESAAERKLLEIAERIEAGEEEFEIMAQTVSEDMGSASNGGELGWTNPGMLVPQFENAIREMDVNELRVVETAYGWHLIELLGWRDRDITDETKRNAAFMAIRNNKAEEETELWLRQLRDGAYVEIRI